MSCNWFVRRVCVIVHLLSRWLACVGALTRLRGVRIRRSGEDGPRRHEAATWASCSTTGNSGKLQVLARQLHDREKEVLLRDMEVQELLKALADREAEHVTFKDEREDAVLTVASKRRQLAETSTQAADSANARLS